jgi:hypothetical protein
LTSARRSVDGSPCTLKGSTARRRTTTPRPVGQPHTGVDHLHEQGLELDRLAGKRRLHAQAREQEEILRESDQLLDFLEARAEHVAIFRRRPVGAQGHLDPALEHRQGRAQLVRRVDGEAPHVGEGGLEPREHRVERLGQVIELVGRPAERQPPREVLGADPPGRPRHRFHRTERGAGEPGAADQREPEPQRHHDGQGLHVAGERPVDVGEGGADLDEPRGRRLLREWDGQKTHALAVRERDRLERRLARAPPLARRGRQRQAPAAQGGGLGLRPAVSPDHAIEHVEEARPEDLAHLGLGPPRLADARVANDLADHQELDVGAADQRAAEHEVRDGADDEHDRQQDAALPQGEARPHREPAAADSHSPTCST